MRTKNSWVHAAKGSRKSKRTPCLYSFAYFFELKNGTVETCFKGDIIGLELCVCKLFMPRFEMLCAFKPFEIDDELTLFGKASGFESLLGFRFVLVELFSSCRLLLELFTIGVRWAFGRFDDGCRAFTDTLCVAEVELNSSLRFANVAEGESDSFDFSILKLTIEPRLGIVCCCCWGVFLLVMGIAVRVCFVIGFRLELELTLGPVRGVVKFRWLFEITNGSPLLKICCFVYV